ncbi:MAG: ABC transporter ATP-binding protein [Planctomycetota bacterium]|jgi:ABC-2 type transport system ATP-binding protein
MNGTGNGAEDAVRFDGVTKRFGEFTAVNDVGFRVQRGTIFGILGSNGAGKTTSIRMLMNIIQPTAGEIRVLGERAGEALKPRLGYLPEERGLYKKMRLQELLRFFGRIKDRSPAFLDERIDHWLERLGLQGWRRRRVEELSKGMSQKLQFIVTVVHAPELLVLDEPFAGLDPVNRDVLRDAILEMHREGTTVVFSTHVMEQAERLCRELILIHRGEVVLGGSLAEVRASEGREAVVLRHHLHAGKDLRGIPGVLEISDHGNEAELTLEEGAVPSEVLRQLLERADVTHFEVREPSLHEIFKRVVRADA